MLRILVITLLALAVVVASAAAQIATQTQTTTSNPNQGAFDKLSPGNQKIAQALYEAQQSNAQTTGSTSTTSKTYTLDDIAAMKQSGKGWGVVFKDMKAQGKLPADVKNLGQLVSGRYQAQSTTSSGTTITTGSGRSQVVGNSGQHGFGSESERGAFGGDSSPRSAGRPSGHSGGVSQGGGRGR